MQLLRYPRHSMVPSVVFAIAASVLLVYLMWAYERELVWMLAVFLPPIWMPVLRRSSPADRAPEPSSAVTSSLGAGLAVLCLVGVLIYLL